nr:hypothetical protein [Methylacidiphilum caldifontis]
MGREGFYRKSFQSAPSLAINPLGPTIYEGKACDWALIQDPY